jgi:hypothetical protein
VEAGRDAFGRRRGLALRRAWTILAATAALAVVPGCGDGDDDERPVDVPAGAVAVVGEAEISERALDRQVAALKRSSSPVSGGAATGGARVAREQARAQALTTLLMAEALEQEARERGVAVSMQEVRQRWKGAKGAQFETRRQLRRFLGRQTEADVLRQLRLQMLGEAIDEQVRADAGGGKEGDVAVKRFRREFQKRWSERTACAKDNTAAQCGDG